MDRASTLLTILVILGMVLAGCQAVQPVAAMETEAEVQPTEVRAAFEFAFPERGLQHGWVAIDVPSFAPETDVVGGTVRWVEVNDDQEVRYVVAAPKCVSLSEDGQAALIAVEITDKWGWGAGDPGQWMQFWLNETDQAFESPLWPPSDVDPGCAYQAPDQSIPLVAGSIAIGDATSPIRAARSPEDQTDALRRIEGKFGFPSPEAWGVDLWITQNFDVVELDSRTHEATGTLDFGVYDVDQREWKWIKSDVKHVLFDEADEAAMVISQITEKTGSGEGEPGEYAYFWVRDGESLDQFGMLYYSDFHPEAGFKEYFPSDDLSMLVYREPAEVIDIESGELAILQ